MFDTITLKKEIERNQREFASLQERERLASGSLASSRTRVTKYRLDADRAKATFEKYQKDFELAEKEHDRLEREHEEMLKKLSEYTRNIESFKRQFRDMSDQLQRQMARATNDNDKKNSRRAA